MRQRERYRKKKTQEKIHWEIYVGKKTEGRFRGDRQRGET
jgi:hypothetical protein